MTHLFTPPGRTTGVAASCARVVFHSFLATALLAAIAAGSPRAATTMSGDEVVVQAHEVIDDDLIVWGSYVRIDGIVRGDLIALGSDVVVEGVVEGDLMAAGKTIYLNGAVTDDARIAAYASALGPKARVGDDCFSLAYSLETKPESQIGGTLWIAARQALLAGSVAEAIAVRAGAVELAGLTGGDVHAVVGGIEGVAHSSLVVDLAIEVPDLADGLRLAPTAFIGGDLDVRAERNVEIASGARIAGETRREPWGPAALSQPLPDDAFDEDADTPWRDALDEFLLLALIGALLLAVLPRFTRERAEEVELAPMQSVGWGIGAIVSTGLVVFVLGIVWLMSLVAFASSSGGLAFGLTAVTLLLQGALMALFLVALLYVAPVFTCIAVGRAVFTRLGRATDDAFRTGLAALLVGASLYCVLGVVPVVGVLVAIAAALAGTGALLQWLDIIRRAALDP